MSEINNQVSSKENNSAESNSKKTKIEQEISKILQKKYIKYN